MEVRAELGLTYIVPDGGRYRRNNTDLTDESHLAETKITDLDCSLNQTDQYAAKNRLIQQKQNVINLNLGLYEKIRVLEDGE